MNTNIHESFLQLVRLGIGTSKDAKSPKDVDWAQLKALADRQGLSAVVLDGLNTDGTNLTDTMPVQMKLEWIGEVLQNYEQRYVAYEKAIGTLSGFYNQHGFKMMVLKGYACSLDWTKPNHRPCGDIDIWQFGKQQEADRALLNSSRIGKLKNKVTIDSGHHHHTVFEWEGFTVENHYDFVNVHAHKSSKELEVIFKELGHPSHIKDNQEFENSRISSTSKNAKGTEIPYVKVNGEKVYLPSPNLHALFLIKHMVSHFAAAEITLRQVLDWAFFVEKHTKEIDWVWLEGLLEKFHMMDFYNCINAICVGDLGFNVKIFPNVQLTSSTSDATQNSSNKFDSPSLLPQFDPALKDKVLADILSPEWTATEPRGFFKRMAYKYRRWQGNAWKQELCYPESRREMFWRGLWAHIIKPS